MKQLLDVYKDGKWVRTIILGVVHKLSHACLDNFLPRILCHVFKYCRHKNLNPLLSMAVSLFMTYFLWMKFELNSLNFNKPIALRLFEFFLLISNYYLFFTLKTNLMGMEKHLKTAAEHLQELMLNN